MNQIESKLNKKRRQILYFFTIAYSNAWITSLFGPELHEIIDWFTRSITQCFPQVLGHSVLVLELFKIVVQTVSEGIITNVVVQHANHTGTLAVRDSVEDLIDFGGWTDGHFDRMAALQAVKLESTTVVTVDKLSPDVEFGQAVVNAKIFDP